MRNEIYLLLSVCLLFVMAFMFANEPVDSAGYYYGTGLGVSPADPRPQFGHTPRPPVIASTDRFQYTVYDHIVYKKAFTLNSQWEATSMRIQSRGLLNMKAEKEDNSRRQAGFMVYSPSSVNWTVIIEMRNGNRWKFIEGENKCLKMNS